MTSTSTKEDVDIQRVEASRTEAASRLSSQLHLNPLKTSGLLVRLRKYVLHGLSESCRRSFSAVSRLAVDRGRWEDALGFRVDKSPESRCADVLLCQHIYVRQLYGSADAS